MSDSAPHGDERELRRLNRALRMLSDSNQALIRITDEGELLCEICRIAVEVGGYRMAWVGLPAHDERKTVQVAAVAGSDKGYLESMDIVWADVPHGRGPAGTAIRTGEVRIIHDIRTDQSTSPWREAARARGYESIVALPLLDEGRVLGALSINASESAAFDPQEMKILAELAGDLAFGITALRARAERARAEELLHQRNEMFRGIVEGSPDIFLRFDRELQLTYVNPAICRMFGLPAEALLNQPIGATAREARNESNREGVAQIRQTVVAVFADGAARELSVRWPTPKGERIFGVRYFAERDRAGAVVSVLAIGRDITEGRQAEEALQNVLRHARSMVMHGVAVAPEDWDQHEAEWSAGRYQWTAYFVNEAAAQEVMPVALLPGEQYHAAWVRARHPEDFARTDLTAARAFVAGASSWRQEFRTIDREERWHWFSQVASLRPAGRGRWNVTTINTDITERKQAEEALRWRTVLFEAQVNSTLDAILVVDRHGTKLLQNERMNELWKIPRHIADDTDDAAQLRYVTSRTKDPVKFAERVAYLYAHPQEVGRDEVELVDGSVLDRYSAPVRDKSGQHYGRIWTFRDITATKQLEEQFRQAQKMEAVGQLAGGIAHDFNNLLTVIQLQSSMMLTEKTLAPAITHSVEQINEAAMRAANLTRQLLTFSRQNVKQARALDVGEVVSSTTRLLRRVLGEDISLESRFASGLPLVHADPGMLEQVLMNLVINSRDAMPQGGRLSLALDVVQLDADYVVAHAAARPGRFVQLSVSDTGVGIAPQNLPRIFEPFFTTKEIGKGTGLGLAMVFGIVQQHQGWIEAESQLGHGATFRVFLPTLDATAIGQAAPAAPPVRGGTETILLVEDESLVRAMAAAALQRGGYRVLEAATAADALRCWDEQQGKIDLLLTDMIMPGGMSGQRLAEALETRQPGLRIIFTSGYSNEAVNRELRFTVGQNFLPKPYPVEELLAIVRQRLDRP